MSTEIQPKKPIPSTWILILILLLIDLQLLYIVYLVPSVE